MSVYGILNEGASFGGPVLEAAEGYKGTSGAFDILAENAINDRMLFNGVIRNDFQEAQLVHESAGADAIMALHESAGTDLIEKVKGFLKKAMEKIKGLIQSFISRFQSVVIRDNKKLVETHRKAVLGKTGLEKMKFKWSAVKGNKDAVYPSMVTNVSKFIEDARKELENSPIKTLNTNIGFHEMVAAGNQENLSDIMTNINSIEHKSEVVSDILGGKVEYDNLNKSAKEVFFEEKDIVEGLSNGLRNNIMTALSESKDVIKALKDAEKKIDNLYKADLNRLNKLSDEFAKFVPSGGTIGDKEHKVTSDQAASAVRGVNFTYNSLKVAQEVTTRLIGCSMNIIKFKTAEARSVWVQAAAFRGVSESGDIDGDSTVEINIEIDENTPDTDPEIIEAIEDDSDHIVEEQFAFGY